MKILAIDTSCDETSAAVTDGRRVLSNVIYSQVLIHKKWGGVVPSLAKRAHEERIDYVILEALKKHHSGRTSEVNFIAVTQGPGLAVALEVGIKKAKELTQKYNKKLIAVNHLEGHIYSAFVQNSKGSPKNGYHFPYLVLIISGGHTSIVIFKDHLDYEVIGETVDDAAGESLDKAAKLLGLGYPGGPVIERLANEAGNKDYHRFPRPMINSKDLNLSFSGLKTSFYYFLRRRVIARTPTETSEDEAISSNKIYDQIATLPRSGGVARNDNNDIRQLASSFQEAVFDTVLKKTEKAIKETSIKQLLVVGGVSANLYLRKRFRMLIKNYHGQVLFPSYKYLTGDNAAMIGVAAYYKAKRGWFVSDPSVLDRIPRLSLT